MTRALTVVVLLALSSAALAQAPGETVAQPLPAALPSGPHKDPVNAVALSIGTTLAGTVLVMGAASEGSGTGALLGLAGMYIGPSTGQWYAGRVGGIGLASRALAAVLIVKGFTKADQQGYDCLGYTDAECAAAEARWDHDAKVGETMIWSGLALWVGSSVFDVVMAHRATTAWNRDHQLSLTPTLMPATGGRATGLSLQLTF